MTSESAKLNPMSYEIEILRSENKKLRKENRLLSRKYDMAKITAERYSSYAASKDSLMYALISQKSKQEGYLELLLENSSDIILIFNNKQRCMYFSDGFKNKFYIESQNNLQGKFFYEVFSQLSEDNFNIISNAYYESVKDNCHVSRELSLKTDDEQSICEYALHISPLLGHNKDSEGTILMLYDQTNLIRARQQAENENKAKSLFLAKISHEIRTPMNAILGMAELSLQENISNSVYEKVFCIKQAANNLLNIINDILDISKIESGKMEIMANQYMLTSLLSDIINIVHIQLLEKPIKFSVYVDSKLPNILIGDEVRIRQCMLNLLTNAIKYTKKGYINLSITGEIEDNITVLSFSVTDTGIGIKQEDLGKVFTDFTQFDQFLNKGTEGTGLGLSITKNLITLMNGNINVESKYGFGTTFTAVIPQFYEKYEPFAKVDFPKSKKVLMFEEDESTSMAVCKTFEDLKVPYMYTSSLENFINEFMTNTYSFIFINQKFAADSQQIMKEYHLDGKLVLFADDKCIMQRENVSILTTPVYANSIANLLNDTPMNDPCKCTKNKVRFTAPKARVLIVDDILTNLKVAEGLLAPYRLIIDTCTSGEKAIEKVRCYDYDIIFMDHMMPGLDGIETTELIRGFEEDKYQTLPIIALTANAVSGTKEMFLQHGFSDYLSKPIDVNKLKKIVERWIPKDKLKRTKTLPVKLNDELMFLGDDLPVSLEAGFRHFSDDRQTYFQVLQSYVKHMPPLLKDLKDSVQDLKNYAIIVHGIKGSSYSVFANKIGEQAEILEQAAKSGNQQKVLKYHDDFITLMERALKELDKIVKQVYANGNKQVKDSPAPDLLLNILSGCETFDIQKMEANLVELEKYSYKNDSDLVPFIRNQLDNLEYERIEEKLKCIL